jgi:hypothetical protein
MPAYPQTPAYYGDTVAVSGCVASDSARLAYSLVNAVTPGAALKSTLVNGKLTFKAAGESVAVKITAPAKQPYSALSKTSGTTTVQARPLSVAVNSPTWTYGKTPSTSEAIKLSLAPGSAPLAFSTDRLPTSGGFKLIDASQKDVTSTPANQLPIGSYTITPNPSLANYSIIPVTGTLTVVPNNASGEVAAAVTTAIPFTAVGQTGQGVVTVSNRTGETLSIMATSLSAPFRETADTSCSNLPTGGSCTITISFTPTAVGPTAQQWLSIGALDAKQDQFTGYLYTVAPVKIVGTGLAAN